MSTLLEVTDLKVRYGNIEALHGLTFHVDEGEIVTLIGANGAGKTTTLLSISRVYPPEGPKVVSGDIRYKGQSILGVAPDKVVSELHAVLVPEGRRIFGNLTVEENLKLATYARKDSDADIQHDYERVYGLFPRLAERRKQRSESLSGGEQQMLAVGRALMTRPKLMMMDEPSLGLAPLVVKDIFGIIKQLSEQGITILLIEQNANAALHAAHYGYVMQTGAITLQDTGEALLNNQSVQEAYLGHKRKHEAHA